MSVPRDHFTATVLNDHRVIVVGGMMRPVDASTSPPTFLPAAITGSVELFDPAPTSMKWSTAPSLALPRTLHTATLLASGKLLVVGGAIAFSGSAFGLPDVATARVELFDPAATSSLELRDWSLLDDTSVPHLAHTATFDALGTKLLVVGGEAIGGGPSDVLQQGANGASCASAIECVSGNCVEGSCCDQPCGGACQECSTGTCKSATGPDTLGRCGDAACVSGCSAGACVFKDATTSCGAPNCFGSTLTPPGHCSGSGPAAVCLAGAPRVCPGNVRCADATSCLPKCTSDADCAGGACDTTNGTCGWAPDGGLAEAGTTDFDAAPPPKLSASVKHCTQPSDCSSGFCADGVCCDSACGETCHSCALPSSPGHCALEPIGVDLRHECGPALSCLGTCGADGQCAVAQKGTTCAPSRCVSPSSGLGPAACSAEGAACPTGDSISFDCGPYACDPLIGACLTTCQSSADCANGSICDTTTNICTQPPPSSGSGGCSYGASGRDRTRSGAGLLAFVAIALAAMRRRARVLATACALPSLAACSAKRDLADVDAGAILTSVTSPASLLAELSARPRLGAVIAARTDVTRDSDGFLFATRRGLLGRLDARLSPDARTLTLADVSAPDAWIEIVAADRGALAPELDDRVVRARGAARDVLFVGGDDRVEEIQIARVEGAEAMLRYALRRGPGVASVRVAGGRVEVLDRAGVVRLRTRPAFAVDARGQVRAMEPALAGDALAFSLDARGLAAPIAIDPVWTTGNSMVTPRWGHTATLLADGRVFVAGGHAAGGSPGITPPAIVDCELYDPKTATWSRPNDGKSGAPLAMGSARASHSALRLNDGRVLLAGSAPGSSGFYGDVPLELFDPVAMTITPFGSTAYQSGGRPVLLMLADGRVLIEGDNSGTAVTITGPAALFDPTKGDTLSGVVLAQMRDLAAGALLPDGTPMIVGGQAPNYQTITDSVLFDATHSLFVSAAPMPVVRAGLSAFSTPTGLLVLAGAVGGDVPMPYSFDVPAGSSSVATDAKGSWSVAPAPPTTRYGATATLLQLPTKSTSARVMLSGGLGSDGKAVSTVELYDVPAKRWATASPLPAGASFGQTVTQLNDGSVLVAGGTSDGATPVATSTQTFQALGVGAACAAGGDCLSGACIGKICCAVASCPAGSSCSPDGSGCVPALGTSCAADADCGPLGRCANGVCCDRACDGLCEACNLVSALGTCTSLGSSCLGEPDDASPAVDGGFADGAPPTIHEPFTRCAKDSDCTSTGHCAEGVCCDTACVERCHSCALPGSIGKCSVEPTGVDLRHECGPGRSCLGTCGQGQCVGAAGGTQCDAPHCTGASSGVGPALCDKAGGSCQTAAVAAFDCTPYTCEPAFGACRSTCSSSDECAQGYLCDTTSQHCVQVPAPSGGGCTVGSDGSVGSFALAVGALGLGLAARRRRRG